MITDRKINFEDRPGLKICHNEETCDAVNYLFRNENLVLRARSEKTGCAIAKFANWFQVSIDIKDPAICTLKSVKR
jgi:hypothetical protein